MRNFNNKEILEAEELLVSRIKEGDRTAMRTLYDRYSGYVMAVALRYVPDRDDVQDVVQDSFVKIFTSIGSFSYRGEGSLKAWMGRIVANMSLDFLRKNKTLSFTSDLPNIADEPEPDIGGVSDEALMSMIARLPDGYRVVLNMFVFEQRSHKEIAEQLGIKESSSASQYLRAKKLLAKKINDYLNTLNEKEYE